MSTTFFTSDHHFSHDYVARERHYSFAELHDEALIDRWNRRVTKRDTVWILGDLGMGSLTDTLEKVSRLNGRKHLVYGNHDAGHPMHRGAAVKLRRYLEVFESAQLAAQIRIDGEKVMLSHFPYTGDHMEVDRYSEWRLRESIFPLLCGHVHAAWLYDGNQFNVGQDFSPGLVSLAAVTEWLRSL